MKRKDFLSLDVNLNGKFVNPALGTARAQDVPNDGKTEPIDYPQILQEKHLGKTRFSFDFCYLSITTVTTQLRSLKKTFKSCTT